MTKSNDEKLIDAQSGTLIKMNHLSSMETDYEKIKSDRIEILKYYAMSHWRITGEVISADDLVKLFDVEPTEAESSLGLVKAEAAAADRLKNERDYYYLKAPWADHYDEVTVEQYCSAERGAGFYNKSGAKDRPATAAFTANSGLRGFISYGKPASSTELNLL